MSTTQNTTFVSFDLETTSTDTSKARVVQFGMVTASDPAWNTGAKAVSKLCYVADIPPGSSEVHKIYAGDPSTRTMLQVGSDGQATETEGCAPFYAYVSKLVARLVKPGVVVVSYNGMVYDVPIVAQYASMQDDNAYMGSSYDPDAIAVFVEGLINTRHVDVFRVWKHYQAINSTADCYAGKLSGAHLCLVGHPFEGAHDATIDCYAALRVFSAMLDRGITTVDLAIALSKQPLPGCVDFAGKFRWVAGRVCIGFGKHKDACIEDVPVSYLQWMIREGFPPSTCQLIRDYLTNPIDFSARCLEKAGR